MEILLLTPQMPYPPQQGTALRNYNIIRGLAGRHAVTLLSFTGEGQREQDWAALGDLCRRILTVPQPAERSTAARFWQMLISDQPDLALRLRSYHFEIVLRRLMSEKRFDIVQIEGVELAWTLPIVRDIEMDQKIVFDAHNAEAYLQRRAYEADSGSPRRWPAATYSLIQARRLDQYEKWALQQADWITAVSDKDRQILSEQLNQEEAHITVIPNCIDVQAYSKTGDDALDRPADSLLAYDLVFTGKMDYRPNVDAVLWFAEKVWPQIIEQRPGSSWAVVGQKPHKRLSSLVDLPGVMISGWVEEVIPFMHQGTVFIMPFRVGSGTRLKLIEAMAAGIPVVSTTLGVEGYDVIHDRHLLLADSGPEMAAAVLRLLREPQTRERLIEQGVQFAQQYDWRDITPKFDEVYHALSI